MYKEKEATCIPKDTSWHPETDVEVKKLKKENSQNLIIQKIDELFEELADEASNSFIYITTLFKLDWATINLHSNIDSILEKYDVPHLLLQLFMYTSTTIVELGLRITNFICRNSMKMLTFMLDNLPQYIHLIRAPRLFPLVCELIDGFCKYFPYAPEKIEKETNLIDTLCKMSSSMPPAFISIACYIISQMLSNISPENFEDFNDVISQPICIVKKFIDICDQPPNSLPNRIQFNTTYLLSSILNLLGSILHIFTGSLNELISEHTMDKLIEIVCRWQSIDEDGQIFSDVLKVWNIIIFEFTDDFTSFNLKEPLIQPLADALKADNCPIGRVLFTLGNIAAIDDPSSAVVTSGAIENGWSRYESFTNKEKELFIFLFLNCVHASTSVVAELDVFHDILMEAFDIYGSVKALSFQQIFMRAINQLLTFDDSITSFIDEDIAYEVFTSAVESDNEEVSAIARQILDSYFSDSDDD